jgi:hypothetical protein
VLVPDDEPHVALQQDFHSRMLLLPLVQQQRSQLAL